MTDMEASKAGKLIVGQQPVEDHWQLLRGECNADTLTAYDHQDIILPLAAWQTLQDAIRQRSGRTGVWLNSDETPDMLASESTIDIQSIPLIALNFPVFSDGRSYTSARALRQTFGYQGELRAIGDVLRDQLFYMRRCGFDAFALREDQDMETALSAFKDFHTGYQSSVDQPLPLFRRRA